MSSAIEDPIKPHISIKIRLQERKKFKLDEIGGSSKRTFDNEEKEKDDERATTTTNSSSNGVVAEILNDKKLKRDHRTSVVVGGSPTSSTLTPASLSSAAEDNVDLESLLAEPSAKEKENKKATNEIMELLNQQTVQEQRMAEKFRSDGTQLQEFCKYGTKENCRNYLKIERKPRNSCSRLHFRKIIQKHTDESLGDCSFLNTCFHMSTCKYIHYEIIRDSRSSKSSERLRRPSGGSSSTAEYRDVLAPLSSSIDPPTKLFPSQWIQCDLRFFDLTVLGKFSVVMADPPWDIHMELPYGTMSDDEMRHLNVQCLQDEGLMFLWVTGRAMELGRECLKLWGYQQCDEIIWVKTNQLQRIIRTGRTGHWLNHGKEHCLVGIKGPTEKYNRGLDCDVIVAEVRATSHKPDEVYGIIERLSPGTRKIELFGRQHNVQHNWITLGNQLDGVKLLDSDVVARFRERYPDGNCMPKAEEVLQYKQKQQQNSMMSSIGGGGGPLQTF